MPVLPWLLALALPLAQELAQLCVFEQLFELVPVAEESPEAVLQALAVFAEVKSEP